jgi:AAHS family 4-hydroxybenzoate transporter-like MFS transporter
MNAQANDVGALIDSRPLNARQLSVIVLCGLVVLLDGFDLQTMSLAVPSLMAEWQIDAGAFSFALSAALIGMLLGSAIVAPFGDRVGRRPILIGGMVCVGVGSVLTAYADTPFQLSAWRFITGIGLGMSLPNATALTSEYVPLRRRVFLISLTYCCVALGAVIAGFVAPVLIDAFGWRAIFIAGGVPPLFIAALLAVGVPESLRLLVAQKPNDPQIALIARRFLPGVDPSTLVARASDQVDRPNVLALLTPAYRTRTVLLWSTFALNLFVLFLLVSWLPTVLSEAGWTRTQSLRGGVMNQAGGIFGGLLIAWLIDRGRIMPAMIGGYLLVALALSLFLVVPGSVPNWVMLLILVGAGVSGGQVALNALSVLFYPTSLRATGAGWANTLGRIGALIAPFAGGFVITRLDLEPVQQLALIVIPVLLCAFFAFFLCFAGREPERTQRASDHSIA